MSLDLNQINTSQMITSIEVSNSLSSSSMPKIVHGRLSGELNNENKPENQTSKLCQQKEFDQKIASLTTDSEFPAFQGVDKHKGELVNLVNASKADPLNESDKKVTLLTTENASLDTQNASKQSDLANHSSEGTSLKESDQGIISLTTNNENESGLVNPLSEATTLPIIKPLNTQAQIVSAPNNRAGKSYLQHATINKKNLIRTAIVVGLATAFVKVKYNHNNKMSQMDQCFSGVIDHLKYNAIQNPYIHKNPSYVMENQYEGFNEIDTTSSLVSSSFPFEKHPLISEFIKKDGYEKFDARPFGATEGSYGFASLELECLPGFIETSFEVNNDITNPKTVKEVKQQVDDVKNKIGNGFFSDYGCAFKLSAQKGSVIQNGKVKICRLTPYSWLKQTIKDVKQVFNDIASDFSS